MREEREMVYSRFRPTGRSADNHKASGTYGTFRDAAAINREIGVLPPHEPQNIRSVSGGH
jgi:hypothetical protein